MKTLLARLLPGLAVLLSSLPASAALLEVGKGPSFTYQVLQDALDAAAPGDTVQLVSGVFSETTSRFADGAWRDVVGWVDKSLTILGSEAAWIDPPDVGEGWGLFAPGGDSVRLQNLSIRDGRGGVQFIGKALVEQCKFLSLASVGVAAGHESTLEIRDSLFEYCGAPIFVAGPVTLSVIQSRAKYTAGQFVTAANGPSVTIRDCSTIVNGLLQLQAPATGYVESCTADSLGGAAFVLLGAGANATARNVRIYGDEVRIAQGGLVRPFTARNGASFDAASMVVINCTQLLYATNGSQIKINDSDLVGWTDIAIDTDAYLTPPTVTLDLRRNYWGGVDKVSLGAAIDDAADYPEGEYFGVVDYSDCRDRSVPLERRSWGSLKGAGREH